MKKFITFAVAVLLINFTGMCSAESSTSVEIMDKGNMPYCVYNSMDEKHGIVFHWDKHSSKIPREIFYSIQNCKIKQPFPKKHKLNFEANLPPLFIGSVELSNATRNKLIQIRNGVNKYLPQSKLSDPHFLDSILGEFKKETNKALIKDYNIYTASLIYHTWISAKELPKDCSSLIGTCDYYLCRESQKACNIDGYFLGFGYQYCSESIVNLTSKVSEKGRTWLKEVATCLQTKMEEVSNHNSCADIKDMAIKSHDECYTQTDFCSLNLKDTYKILKMLKPEFDDKRIIKEGLEVLKNCRV